MLELKSLYGAYGELVVQYDGSLSFWNSTAGGETIGRAHTDGNRLYYLKDHLGSVGVTISDDENAAGWDDYYPFGLQMPGREDNSANDFDDQKFTGHFLEQEGDLGIYHVGARLPRPTTDGYDPEVPRFYGVDAMRATYNPKTIII